MDSSIKLENAKQKGNANQTKKNTLHLRCVKYTINI